MVVLGSILEGQGRGGKNQGRIGRIRRIESGGKTRRRIGRNTGKGGRTRQRARAYQIIVQLKNMFKRNNGSSLSIRKSIKSTLSSPIRRRSRQGRNKKESTSTVVIEAETEAKAKAGSAPTTPTRKAALGGGGNGSPSHCDASSLSTSKCSHYSLSQSSSSHRTPINEEHVVKQIEQQLQKLLQTGEGCDTSGKYLSQIPIDLDLPPETYQVEVQTERIGSIMTPTRRRRSHRGQQQIPSPTTYQQQMPRYRYNKTSRRNYIEQYDWVKYKTEEEENEIKQYGRAAALVANEQDCYRFPSPSISSSTNSDGDDAEENADNIKAQTTTTTTTANSTRVASNGTNSSPNTRSTNSSSSSTNNSPKPAEPNTSLFSPRLQSEISELSYEQQSDELHHDESDIITAPSWRCSGTGGVAVPPKQQVPLHSAFQSRKNSNTTTTSSSYGGGGMFCNVQFPWMTTTASQSKSEAATTPATTTKLNAKTKTNDESQMKKLDLIDVFYGREVSNLTTTSVEDDTDNDSQPWYMYKAVNQRASTPPPAPSDKHQDHPPSQPSDNAKGGSSVDDHNHFNNALAVDGAYPWFDVTSGGSRKDDNHHLPNSRDNTPSPTNNRHQREHNGDGHGGGNMSSKTSPPLSPLHPPRENQRQHQRQLRVDEDELQYHYDEDSSSNPWYVFHQMQQKQQLPSKRYEHELELEQSRNFVGVVGSKIMTNSNSIPTTGVPLSRRTTTLSSIREMDSIDEHSSGSRSELKKSSVPVAARKGSTTTSTVKKGILKNPSKTQDENKNGAPRSSTAGTRSSSSPARYLFQEDELSLQEKDQQQHRKNQQRLKRERRRKLKGGRLHRRRRGATGSSSSFSSASSSDVSSSSASSSSSAGSLLSSDDEDDDNENHGETNSDISELTDNNLYDADHRQHHRRLLQNQQRRKSSSRSRTSTGSHYSNGGSSSRRASHNPSSSAAGCMFVFDQLMGSTSNFVEHAVLGRINDDAYAYDFDDEFYYNEEDLKRYGGGGGSESSSKDCSVSVDSSLQRNKKRLSNKTSQSGNVRPRQQKQQPQTERPRKVMFFEA